MKTKWLNFSVDPPKIGDMIMIWHLIYNEPMVINFDSYDLFVVFKHWYPATEPEKISL